MHAAHPTITLRAEVHATIPHAAQVAICDATEALRLFDALAQRTMDALDAAPPRDDDDCLPCPTTFQAMQAAARIFTSILQETFGVMPSIDDRVFRVIKSYENRWPTNLPHIEAVILALKLAVRLLDGAREKTNAVEFEALDEVVLAAADIFDGHAGLLESSAVGCRGEEVLDAIIAGEPLPEFCPAEYVAKARAWMNEEARA